MLKRRVPFCLVLVFAAATHLRAENVSQPTSASVEVVRSIVYATREGRTLRADIYRPVDVPGRLPTILMLHGGAWLAGDKVHVTLHARYAAARGYAVMATNYRLAPQHKFPAQLDDCRTALAWLKENASTYDFDSERVAVYGYSAGGQLACLVAATLDAMAPQDRKRLPVIRAAVGGGSPCEFSWIPNDSMSLAYWLGGSRAQLPDVYAAASPVQHVTSNDPPMLLFHGKQDRIVPFRSAKLMAAKLEERGVPSELVLRDGNHISTFLDPQIREAAVDFLDRHLRD